MDKYDLSERDICTKFITPAIQAAGWQQGQFREEVSLTDGRVMVRGKLTDFLRRWNSAERKQAVLEELADHGVPREVLQQPDAACADGDQ